MGHNLKYSLGYEGVLKWMKSINLCIRQKGKNNIGTRRKFENIQVVRGWSEADLACKDRNLKW